jgi:hypothetical protein
MTPTDFKMKRGTLVHAALAHYYGAMMPSGSDLLGPVAAMVAAADADRGGEPELATEFGEAALIWYQYLEREASEPLIEDGASVVDVEVEWAHTTNAGNLYTQRVDVVARDIMGQVWAIDHKTFFSRDLAFYAHAQTMTQVIGYHALGRKIYGAEFGGVILNFIPADQIRCKAPAQRRVITPLEPAIADFFDNYDKWEAIVMAHKGKPAGAWPATYTSASCSWCPFRQQCLGG